VTAIAGLVADRQLPVESAGAAERFSVVGCDCHTTIPDRQGVHVFKRHAACYCHPTRVCQLSTICN
jgi:hypothetical protein